MTYAVQALAKTEIIKSWEAKASTWQIIMLTDSHRTAARYVERHNMNGGIPLRVVGVTMSRETQESICPFIVEVSTRDKRPTMFRYEPEALAYASRFLNSIIRRPD